MNRRIVFWCLYIGAISLLAGIWLGHTARTSGPLAECARTCDRKAFRLAYAPDGGVACECSPDWLAKVPR